MFSFQQFHIRCFSSLFQLNNPFSILLRGRNLLLKRQYMRQWSNRCDGERVDLCMAPGVVPLDVLELCRLLERRLVPVQVAHPAVHSRVS
jgi:hypothetical protein